MLYVGRPKLIYYTFIKANANDINTQTEIIEESSNAQVVDIIIESYVGPSSKGSGKGVKMYKIKKVKQENQLAKENKKAKTKQSIII